MAEVRIEHVTRFSKDEIREKVGEVMSQVEQRFGLTGRWDGDRYGFSRSGLEGTATISEGRVTIEMRLGMLLSALRGRIESELRTRLAERLP